MFKENINKCIKECREELLNSKNTKIKKLLKEITSELEGNLENDLLDSIIGDAMEAIMITESQDEDTEKIVISLLQDIKKLIPLKKKSYTMNISLKGLEKEIYRSVKMPAMTSLADLGYTILSIFNAESNHLFEFVIKKEKYKCEIERYVDDPCFGEEEEYASDYMIDEFNFKASNKFTMTYDYGDNYEFSIQVFSINHEDVFQNIESIEVLDGKGYGIWEDAHYELDLYYSDKKEFTAFIKENGIDFDYYPVDEEFDIEECNEYLLSSFLESKISYEENFNDIEF